MLEVCIYPVLRNVIAKTTTLLLLSRDLLYHLAFSKLVTLSTLLLFFDKMVLFNSSINFSCSTSVSPWRIALGNAEKQKQVSILLCSSSILVIIHFWCCYWYCFSASSELIEILFFRPIYAGNALCTVRYTGMDPCIMTVRSTSFSLPPTSTALSDAAPISQVDLSTISEGLLCISIIYSMMMLG